MWLVSIVSSEMTEVIDNTNVIEPRYIIFMAARNRDG